MYAFIDESGDSGYTTKSSKYFIIACILFEDVNVPRRIARNVFKKFRLYLQDKDKLHATNDKDRVKIKMVSEILQHKHKVVYIQIKKSVLGKDYYLESIKKLLDKIVSQNVDMCYIAKKDSRKSVQNKILKYAEFLKIKAEFKSMTDEKGLQVADFISWAIYQKFERQQSVYFSLLKMA